MRLGERGRRLRAIGRQRDSRASLSAVCGCWCGVHVCLCVCAGRVQRLRQAQEEAEKTIKELREANKASFQRELASQGQGEHGFAGQLKQQQEADARNIAAGYDKNKQEVIDLLLRHVCTVELEVGEALKQSLLTKAETGTQ